MSDTGLSRHDQILLGLVYSLQVGAMQQLGKVQDPASGEIRRDLAQARATIDVLEMLKVKCRTGTPEEVLRVVDQAVMDLQLNYMDERKKDAAAAAPGDSAAEQPGQADPDPERTAD